MNKITHKFLIFFIILLGILLYSNIVNAPFIFDDHRYIRQNELVHNFDKAISNFRDNRYLTLLSFSINYLIGGFDTSGYHFLNNAIHIINALLVYVLIYQTFRTPHMANFGNSAYFAALFGSLLFVCHPVQTQAVTYIVQRAASLATMFYLLSLNMYIAWRLQLGSSPQRKNLLVYFFYGLSLFSAICAMKTKEIAFTLPFMIALYEFCFFSKEELGLKALRIKRILLLLPFFFTSLIIPLSMITKKPLEGIVQNLDIISKEASDISRLEYLMTQFSVIVTYLKLLVFPVDLNFDYEYPVYNSFFEPRVLFSFFILVSLISAGVYSFHLSKRKISVGNRRILRLAAFGIFWFFIALSVESSVMPITDVIVEHRMYLPSVGFILAFTSFMTLIPISTYIKSTALIGIIILLSIATYNRNMLWNDPQLLWEDVIEKAPNNARAYNNLGVIFKQQGKFEMAINQFEKSLTIKQTHPSVYFNLGDVEYRLGNYAPAEAHLKTSLTMNPESRLRLDILNKLGRTYSAMGRTDEAIELFEQAIIKYPSALPLYNNLSVQYAKLGKIDLAINLLEKGLSISEDINLRNNLLKAYVMKNDQQHGRKKELLPSSIKPGMEE